MVESISLLMEKLKTDPWRAEVGFSDELKRTMYIGLRFKPGQEDEVTRAFNDWIRKNQPCLFGRIAAKQCAITYCLISEEMLYGSEAEIETRIQEARLRWTQAGFEGKSSNFIIAVLSERLALAVPDESVKSIAIRLCSLYLKEPIQPDRVYLDRIYLEQPGSRKVTWEWLVGVNYFSAQGDGRWWQDHRFPAGIAFSMNSIGHMVKSGKLIKAIHDLEDVMGTALPEYRIPNVDSLDKALELAMHTIYGASEAVSGKATSLIPALPSGSESCPIDLPEFLVNFDHSKYSGFYHTDYTVPSDYFSPDIARPANAMPYDLDFTYLFRKDLSNPDFDRMGEGRRIRLSEVLSAYESEKRARGRATEVRIADVPRLQEALKNRA
jgi:hypothetical protein